MFTSSMSTSQFPGRGVCGARKLIPMSLKISCAHNNFRQTALPPRCLDTFATIPN